MMKKSLLVAGLAVWLVGAAFGQIKIGFVDSNRAVVETDEGKVEFQKILDWLQSQENTMQGMQKEYEEKQTQLRNQQNILSDEKRVALIGQLDALETQLKRRQEDIRKDYAIRLDEFGKRMDRKITPLFHQFAKEHGYTAVFYINPQVLAYFDEAADVTDEIIKLYNKAHPYKPGS